MIRKATETDQGTLARLASMLWEGHSFQELILGFSNLLRSTEAACFLAEESGIPVGFAQCQLRHDYVEGTKTSPVGYLEGIFVLPEYRSHGWAKQLLSASETWAREQGCQEFASDCELENVNSLKFHLHAGFVEVNRVICFAKKL